jgi:hypothetical protein
MIGASETLMGLFSPDRQTNMRITEPTLATDSIGGIFWDRLRAAKHQHTIAHLQRRALDLLPL